jgi:hypothetical protein
MNVTVYIPTELITAIEEQYFERFNKKMSEDLLRAFLQQDIVVCYEQLCLDGLDDALDLVA